jgi:hypothetical protein
MEVAPDFERPQSRVLDQAMDQGPALPRAATPVCCDCLTLAGLICRPRRLRFLERVHEIAIVRVTALREFLAHGAKYRIKFGLGEGLLSLEAFARAGGRGFFLAQAQARETAWGPRIATRNRVRRCSSQGKEESWKVAEHVLLS